MRYKSCNWIENGISFDVDSYKVCCLYSSEGGGNTVVKANYKGELINWNEFFFHKQKIKDAHQKGKINSKCNGCVNLVEKDWTFSNNKISFINLDYWTKCNSCCSFCFTSKNKEYYNSFDNYNFLPILEDMIQKGIISPEGHVSFGGGEVTLLSEFEIVLNKLIDLGFKHIKIHTSCIQYSNAIEYGLGKGVIELIVSVDSGSKSLHKKIKGVESYDQVWNNLSKYISHKKGNSTVKTKYILIPDVNDSITEIDLWLEKSKNIGVSSVIQEIESEWFYKRRDNVPKYIIKYFEYAKNKALSLNLNYELYERAEHMMFFYIQKHKNIVCWFVKRMYKKIFAFFKKIKSKIFSFFSPLC